MSEETKVRKSKKPANYALEVSGAKSAEGWDIWFQIKDGFASPEQALEFAKANKVQGHVRVVRVATPVYGGAVINPEPVYTLKRVDATVEKTSGKRKASKKVPSHKSGVYPEATVKEQLPPEVLESLPPDEGEHAGEDADASGA